ncbi:MAG TPA: hypothetical protein VLT33_40635 [Labilithrix sp.]|nr:hypothetical protein [Labilithrix sp.]
MIADGDSVAKNAFRVALLNAEDTPLPVNRTQELDPNDILEVRDMAEAIARAEQLVSAPRSSRPAPPSSRRGVGETDLFESLGRRPTDDTAGPATPAPLATMPSALHLLRPEATIRAPLPTRAPTPTPTPVHELVLSLPSTEEDAYFAPAGRIRSLADQTLDGYRPEPTLLLRARARRSSFKWILGAVLLPLIVLAAVAIFGQQETPATAATSTTTIATATLTTAPPAKPVPVAIPTATQAAAQAKTPAAVVTSTKPAAASPGVPVFDVNSLPTAKPGAR